MKVLEVPSSLDYRGIEELMAKAVTVEPDKLLLDGRHTRFVDPAGMIGLLGVGRFLQSRGAERVRLQMDPASEVSGYLARMGFYQAASGIFEVDAPPERARGRSSDVLLEITPIAENQDVHALVEHVQERAGSILSRTLHYPPSAVVQFSVILSEVCQNILEHAGAPGWVAAQTYQWSRRLGRQVLVIAVGDLGRGFRGSLESEHAGRFGARWSDSTALEAAFIHGLTRFPDQGRGQGIQQIRKQVRRWGGVIAVRSGSARIADTSEWEEFPPLEDGLADFPGAWITILLPEADPEGGK
ncbi:MAG: hypothetical protein EA351_02720 [Gemmatimonadales bacterium]|nr:MAG: hypothetical protein EA351_02720 [Gemmatimonadales bacterium]